MQERQIYIADTNHGTILLSDIEKEVISTKLFNRLHHVSQNSTAYLTFPTNRTKRFEHSVGTMKLCGDIFYNSICNTEQDLISSIFSKIKNLISEKIIKEKSGTYKAVLGDASFKNKGERLKNFLKEDELENIFYNRCIPQNIKKDDKLLYIIIFQAVRLCGLLHDIGHPPFSHITEHSMNEIYQLLKKKPEEKLTEREKQYLEIIKDYDDGGQSFQLHEKMGIKMTEQLISQLLSPENEAFKYLCFEKKWFKIVVFELTMLFFEESDTLEPIHKIVSGAIDGDRLDYVNRDIHNSGIDNGKIEYNRLISSCKFHKVKYNEIEKIEVVFDAKTINTIEDFFMKRWYLYKNIINHHRVSKTDTILQNCVETIIKDHLSKTEQLSKIEDNVLPDDISGLWLAIERAYSTSEYFDSLIQWDDNWLLTILKKYYFENYCEKEQTISYMLEEFLSNKKNYYSVIKNNKDFYLFSNAFEDEIENYDKEKKEQYQNIEKCKKDEGYKKIDAKYPQNYKNRTMHVMFAYLGSVLGKEVNIKESMDKFIQYYYKDKVADYFVVFKKIKNGLIPEPMLYSYGEVLALSDLSNIRSILELEKSNCPYFYVYLKLKEEISLNNEFREDFLKRFGEFLANEVNEMINCKEKK